MGGRGEGGGGALVWLVGGRWGGKGENRGEKLTEQICDKEQRVSIHWILIYSGGISST